MLVSGRVGWPVLSSVAVLGCSVLSEAGKKLLLREILKFPVLSLAELPGYVFMQKMLLKYLDNIYCLSLFSQEKKTVWSSAIKCLIVIAGLGISGLQQSRGVLCSILLVTLVAVTEYNVFLKARSECLEIDIYLLMCSEEDSVFRSSISRQSMPRKSLMSIFFFLKRGFNFSFKPCTFIVNQFSTV